jgi:hypothetical protein
MYRNFISLAGVVLLLLTVAKGLFPAELGFLPLGGSSISELGIVLGFSVACANVWDLQWKSGGRDAQNQSDRHSRQRN